MILRCLLFLGNFNACSINITLEVTNDPTYLRDIKDLLSLYSEFENFLEERMTLSHESSLGPLHAYGLSSSKSPHHSSYSKSYHDSLRHYPHSSSSMSSSSTKPPSSSSSQFVSSSTSPKSHIHKGPKLTENETSHFIDCDGDPYDSDFETKFYYFCIQYLDDISASFEDEKAYYCAC